MTAKDNKMATFVVGISDYCIINFNEEWNISLENILMIVFDRFV